MNLENDRGSKVTKPDFLVQILFFLKWTKCVKNDSKIGGFLEFQKFWHHLLLKIISNERLYDSLFSNANPLFQKMLLHK